MSTWAAVGGLALSFSMHGIGAASSAEYKMAWEKEYRPGGEIGSAAYSLGRTSNNGYLVSGALQSDGRPYALMIAPDGTVQWERILEETGLWRASGYSALEATDG